MYFVTEDSPLGEVIAIGKGNPSALSLIELPAFYHRRESPLRRSGEFLSLYDCSKPFLGTSKAAIAFGLLCSMQNLALGESQFAQWSSIRASLSNPVEIARVDPNMVGNWIASMPEATLGESVCPKVFHERLPV
jgi:hypothetical protein